MEILAIVIGILAGVFGILTGIVQLVEYFKKRKLTSAKFNASSQEQTIISSQTHNSSLDFLNNEQLWNLAKLLDRYFNESELKSLCFKLNIDFENLAGEQKAEKALELVKRMQRHEKIEFLILECKNLRPKVEWPLAQEILAGPQELDSWNQAAFKAAREIYLQAVLDKYQEWSSTFSDLSILFHPTSVSVRPEMGRLINTSAKKNQIFKLHEVIKQQRRVIVLGEPGSGKTTLLQKGAYDQAVVALQNPIEPFPILIRLADYLGGEDIGLFIKRQASMQSSFIGENFPHLMKSNLVWLFLDGLDEVPVNNFKNAIKQIEKYLSTYAQATIVITSRVDSYNKDFSLSEVTVERLDAIQRKNYILKYLPKTGEKLIRQLENTELEKLGRNPYFLRMLILVFENNDDSLSNDTNRLIASFTDVLILRELEKAKSTTISQAIIVSAIEHLALGMLLEGLRGAGVSHDWVKQNIPNPLKIGQHAFEIDHDVLIEIAVEANLLSWSGGKDSVRFYHQLIQEYFQNRTQDSLQTLLFQRLHPFGYDFSAQDLIRKAFSIALSAHQGRARFSGEGYIYHLVAVALILSRSTIKQDEKLIVAGLVHDVPTGNLDGYRIIEETLGKEVSLLVEGVNQLKQKVKQLQRNNNESGSTDDLFSDLDARIVMVKLADRLHNIQTVSFLSAEKQKEKVEETLNYYLPLAKKFGFIDLGRQLEKALYIPLSKI